MDGDRDDLPARRDDRPSPAVDRCVRTDETERVERSRSWAGAVGLAMVIAAVGATIWFDHRLVALGRDDLAFYSGGNWTFGAALIVVAAVGALVVHRSGHLAAAFLLAAAVSCSAALCASSYAGLGLLADPGSLPGALWVAPWSRLLFFGAYPCVAAALLVTPAGRPRNRRWSRVLAAVLAAEVLWLVGGLFGPDPMAPPFEAIPSPYRFSPLAVPLAVATAAGTFLTLGGVVAGIVSVVVSYRHSHGDERQQLRWLTFAAVVAAVAVGGAIAAAASGSSATRDALIAVAMVVFASGLSIAVTKYRLYDLDLVVNRSIVYGLLTIAIVVVYVVAIAIVGLVFDDSATRAGVAAITVALAATPLRRGAERVVARTVFGAAADPFELVSSLHRAVQEAPVPQQALDAFVRLAADGLRLPSVAIEGPDGTTLAAHGVTGEGGPLVEVGLDEHGEHLGRLLLGLLPGERALDHRRRRVVDELGRLAGQAVRTALLVSDVQQSRRRIVSAQQEERRRLRRDLHDGLGPRLTGIALKSDAAANLIDDDPLRSTELMREVSLETRTAIGDVRRLVYDLRPPALDELGLVEAIRDDAARLRLGDRTTVEVVADELPDLGAAVEVAAYRIVTEAITNSSRHGKATTCRVQIALNGRLEVTVDDDGRGLCPGWRPGVGVLSMRERAEEIGGFCEIGPGDEHGVRVRAVLPLEDR